MSTGRVSRHPLLWSLGLPGYYISSELESTLHFPPENPPPFLTSLIGFLSLKLKES